MAEKKEKIQLIPRTPAPPSLIVNLAFYFSILFLIFTIILAVFLNFKIKKLDNELIQKQQKLSALQSSETLKKKNELLNLNSEIRYFFKILDQKNYPSKVFDFISKNTHKNVYFNSFSWDAKDNSVSLSGATKSLKDLSEQILIFQSQNCISNFLVSDIKGSKEGEIVFSISFKFNKNFNQ